MHYLKWGDPLNLKTVSTRERMSYPITCGSYSLGYNGIIECLIQIGEMLAMIGWLINEDSDLLQSSFSSSHRLISSYISFYSFVTKYSSSKLR